MIPLTEFKPTEPRLRWFVLVHRRDSECISRRMLMLELPDRSPRGEPKVRLVDVVNQDMKVVGMSAEDAEDWMRWRQLISYSHQLGEQREYKYNRKWWQIN